MAKNIRCRSCGKIWNVPQSFYARKYICPCCAKSVSYAQYAGVDDEILHRASVLRANQYRYWTDEKTIIF